MDRAAEHGTITVEDIYTTPVQWGGFCVIADTVHSLVVDGLLTCPDEVTLPSSVLTITTEGMFVAREHYEDVDKGLYDENALRMLWDVGRRIRAGVKVCVITSSQRRGRVKDSLMRMHKNPPNLLVTSLGDSGIIWKTMTLAEAPDYEVFIEPMVLDAQLGVAIRSYNKYVALAAKARERKKK
jgi:hypothetical protein